MVLIPKFLSSKQITDVSPTQRVQREEFAGQAKVNQEIAKAVGEMAGLFEKIALEIEVSKADAQMRRELQSLEVEAQTSPDMSPGTYTNRIRQIREDASRHITTPRARGKFKSNSDNLTLMSEFNIKRTIHKRQTVLRIESASEDFNEMSSEYINAYPSEKSQNLTIKNMETDVDEMVRDRVLTPEGGKKWKKDVLNSWRETELSFDLENEPKLAKVELEKKEKGKYRHLTSDQRRKGITTADKLIKKEEAQEEKDRIELHVQNEVDQMMLYFDDKLTLDMVKKITKEEGVSSTHTRVMRDVLVSADSIKLKSKKEQDAMMTKLLKIYYPLDESDLGALMEYRNRVMFEHSLGFVSKEDANFLIEKTVDPFTEQKAEKKSFISNALQEISKWVEITDSPDIVAARMLRRLVFKAENGNLSGEQIDEAAKEIIETETKTLSPTRDQFEINQVIDTLGGPGIVKGFDVDGEPLIELIEPSK